ncbi:hypothetical protein [Prosthecobacter vanneervenii]|uniref:Uncharacterized protein n=1 Tax=Prosthecobacter vanneervenii TaxID=48466 RepID=A0A7W7YCT2_9BACT|nr:hypothetical protein [Prosthecobacter vanneervenii]MBB5033823.1 hypothetical protein [Prosthecobacter vanneervenii]
MNPKKPRKAGFGALALLLLIFWGPHCIQLFYYFTTPPAVISSHRQEYQRLANEESDLATEARMASIRQRSALYLWFHARGLNIDEGDDHESQWESIKRPWQELIQYWRL